MAQTTLPESKRCPRCGEIKEAGAFNTRTVDGGFYLSSKCRSCSADYAREIRKDPRVKELVKQSKKRTREKQKDDPAHQLIRKEWNRRSYQKNKESRRCRQWAAYHGDPEVRRKDNERSKQRREKYKGVPLTDKQKATLKRACQRISLRNQQNPEWVAKDRAKNRAWVAANKDRARSYKLAYMNRKRAGGGDPFAIRQATFECLESYRIGSQYWDVFDSRLIDQPSIDHIVALKSGGTNDVDNLCVTSRANNSAKREMSLLMYLWKRAVKYKLR